MPARKGLILSQRTRRTGPLPQLAFAGIALLLPAMTVLTAFGIAPGTVVDEISRTPVRQSVALPEFMLSTPPQPRFVSQERVLRGDTVAMLLERLGVRDPRALDFLRADATGRLIFRQLVPGRMLQAESGAEGELLTLRYFMGNTSLLEVARA